MAPQRHGSAPKTAPVSQRTTSQPHDFVEPQSPSAIDIRRVGTAAPTTLSSADILMLQRTQGNRAVQHMLVARRAQTDGGATLQRMKIDGKTVNFEEKSVIELKRYLKWVKETKPPADKKVEFEEGDRATLEQLIREKEVKKGGEGEEQSSIRFDAPIPEKRQETPVPVQPAPTARQQNMAAQQRDLPVPIQAVKPNVKARLDLANSAIEKVKAAFPFGAANQPTMVKATGGTSRSRKAAAENPSFWGKEGSEVPPEELANRARLCQGGSCRHYGSEIFTILLSSAPGQILNLVSAKGDHKFVIIGDMNTEDDTTLVVADAWPLQPQACLWKDHFSREGGLRSEMTTKPATGAPRDMQAGLTLVADTINEWNAKIDELAKKLASPEQLSSNTDVNPNDIISTVRGTAQVFYHSLEPDSKEDSKEYQARVEAERVKFSQWLNAIADKPHQAKMPSPEVEKQRLLESIPPFEEKQPK